MWAWVVAIRSSFQASRRSCQLPRRVSTTIPTMAVRVGTSRGRKRPSVALSAGIELVPAALVLEHDRQALEGAHQTDGEAERQGQPNQEVEPERAGIRHLYDEGGRQDHEADGQDDEGGRTGAADGVRAADEAAAPAVGATAAQAGDEGRRSADRRPAGQLAGVVVKWRPPPHQ